MAVEYTYRGKEVERQQHIFMYRAVHIFVGDIVNGLREGWRGRRINKPEGITNIQFKIRSLEVSLLAPPPPLRHGLYSSL